MYIQKEMTVNGVATLIHRLVRIEFTDDAGSVLMASYATVDSPNFVTSMTYAFPANILTGNLKTAVLNWLIASGNPFAGGSIVSDEIEFQHRKDAARTEINDIRDQNIHLGCVTPFGILDTDEVSIRNILGSCQAAQILLANSMPFSVEWKMQDNSEITLDGPEMLQIGILVMQHISGCYSVSWGLKADVAATTTLAQLEAIDFSEGWDTLATHPLHVAP